MKSKNNNNDDDDDDNNNTAMGSDHARGDIFLTFGLKALTETNTSRLATAHNLFLQCTLPQYNKSVTIGLKWEPLSRHVTNVGTLDVPQNSCFAFTS
jgi:hypothetical protein